MVLNNDVIVHKDCIRRLMSFARNISSAAAVAPVILSYDDSAKIESMGIKFNFKTGRLHKIKHGSDYSLWKLLQGEAIEVAAVQGCAMLLRVEALKRVGLFREDFYMYMEDIELCLRMKDMGYGVYVLPDAIVWHLSASRNSKDKYYYSVRNHIKLLKHRYKGSLNPFYIVRNLFIPLTYFIHAVRHCKGERISCLRSSLKGAIEALLA
jgi:hypothetical protein